MLGSPVTVTVTGSALVTCGLAQSLRSPPHATTSGTSPGRLVAMEAAPPPAQTNRYPMPVRSRMPGSAVLCGLPTQEPTEPCPALASTPSPTEAADTVRSTSVGSDACGTALGTGACSVDAVRLCRTAPTVSPPTGTSMAAATASTVSHRRLARLDRRSATERLTSSRVRAPGSRSASTCSVCRSSSSSLSAVTSVGTSSGMSHLDRRKDRRVVGERSTEVSEGDPELGLDGVGAHPEGGRDGFHGQVRVVAEDDGRAHPQR